MYPQSRFAHMCFSVIDYKQVESKEAVKKIVHIVTWLWNWNSIDVSIF